MLGAVLGAQQASAEDIAIHAGHMVDGLSRAPRTRVIILVHEDRIVSIISGFSESAGARIVGLSDKTVLPEMIDADVHLVADLSRYSVLLPCVTRSGYDELLSGVANARATLLAGFTSVRDFGGDTAAIVALKKSIAVGETIGPRSWVSGEPLGPTGGHWDKHTQGIANQRHPPTGRMRARCNTPFHIDRSLLWLRGD
ncbi:MAG TPA: hypothetical protein VF463_17070 [Sphingobium sp.]